MFVKDQPNIKNNHQFQNNSCKKQDECPIKTAETTKKTYHLTKR
jgi:hypothetical protein